MENGYFCSPQVPEASHLRSTFQERVKHSTAVNYGNERFGLDRFFFWEGGGRGVEKPHGEDTNCAHSGRGH